MLVRKPLSESHFPEQLSKSRESLIARCLVGRVAIAETLTETHESVICTFVCDGIIEFTGCFHCVCCRRNAAVNSTIFPSVEAIYRCVNRGDVCRAGAIEHENCAQVPAVRGERQGLPAAPRAPHNADLAVST